MWTGAFVDQQTRAYIVVAFTRFFFSSFSRYFFPSRDCGFVASSLGRFRESHGEFGFSFRHARYFV